MLKGAKMRNSQSVTIRMDKEDKKLFESIVHSMGLNLSSAFNVFAKAVIRENTIPFNLKGYEIPNAETRKSIENIEKGIGLETVTIEQLKAEYEAKKIREQKNATH